MRKLSIFSLLFVFSFGMTIGIVTGLSDNAQADRGECVLSCLTELNCTLDQHPQCYNPRYPYAVFLVSTCTGGPLNCPTVFELVGCWRGSGHCFPMPIP